MAEKKTSTRKPRKRRNKYLEEEYYARSGSLNITIYDSYGNRLPKDFTDEVLDKINAMATEKNLTFSHTFV